VVRTLLPSSWRLAHRRGRWVLRIDGDVVATAPTAFAMLLRIRALLVK